jgi:hypothetical protein
MVFRRSLGFAVLMFSCLAGAAEHSSGALPTGSSRGSSNMGVKSEVPSKADPSWAAALDAALPDDSSLFSDPPGGIKKVCSNYDSLQANEKRQVLNTFLLGVAYAESGFKTTDSMKEKFTDSSGENVDSRGLMAISKESANGHNKACRDQKRSFCGCEGATDEKLLDPVFNLQCGATILESQSRAYKNFLRDPNSIKDKQTRKRFSDNPEGQGLFVQYYWAVLNPKVDADGYGRFKKYMEEQHTLPDSCQMSL